MGDARTCTAKSKRTGERCRARVYKREDGTYTSTCRAHSGGHQLRAPGDPKNGGAPCANFRFSRAIRSVEDREDFEAFLVDTTNLNRQIALAELNLVRFIRKYEESERGGIPSSIGGGGKSVTFESYDRIVRSYLETIGRLRERQARIEHLGNPSAPPPNIRLVFGDADEVQVEDALRDILDRRGVEGDG
jgi:hypothetical protein